MNFAEYLASKKIDETLFQERENALWVTWKDEFDTMHPNSFTAQKLYLINPIRRKYPLKIEVVNPAGSMSSNPAPETTVASKSVKPAMAKPSMPKPAISKPVVSDPKSENDSEKNPSSPESVPPKEQPTAKPVMAKLAIPRPVMKPKPKTD